MILAVKALCHTTGLYSIVFIHQFLDIIDDNLELDVLFLQHHSENLIRMLSHVNVHSKPNLVRRLPKIKLLMTKTVECLHSYSYVSALLHSLCEWLKKLSALCSLAGSKPRTDNHLFVTIFRAWCNLLLFIPLISFVVVGFSFRARLGRCGFKKRNSGQLLSDTKVLCRRACWYKLCSTQHVFVKQVIKCDSENI